MSEEDIEEFDKFLSRNWWIKPQKFDYEEKEEKKRRGRKPKTITE